MSPSPSARILVVDDETDLVRLVAYNLSREKYEVICAYDGKAAMQMALEKQPNLIVLDLMLPDHSGYVVCRQLKEQPETRHIPIIFLTARSAEVDRVAGFEAGAEDYVIKPFSPKELVLRVKAMLGRTMPLLTEPFMLGCLTLMPDTREVRVNGEPVALTALEFNILSFFSRSPGIVKTREQLLKDVWRDGGEEVLDRTVDAHVKRLRSKLGPARDYIETVRGVGYRLSMGPQQVSG